MPGWSASDRFAARQSQLRQLAAVAIKAKASGDGPALEAAMRAYAEASGQGNPAALIAAAKKAESPSALAVALSKFSDGALGALTSGVKWGVVVLVVLVGGLIWLKLRR